MNELKNMRLRGVIETVPFAAKLEGRKFSLALYKNVRIIEEHLIDLDKLRLPSDEYKKIEILIQKKHEELADKDPATREAKTEIKKLPDGQEQEQYVLTIPDNIKKADDYVMSLKKKHPKLFKEQEARVKRFIEAMNDDCKLPFHIVAEKDLPTNMTPAMMFSFDFMIKLK